MADDDDDVFELTAPELMAKRDAVGKAIAEYLTAIRPDETPYVTAWAVAIEWTNAELEQSARAGRDIIMPIEQTISASAGLGVYLTNRFG